MTPTADELLAELRHLGAVAYRVGDMIRLRPAEVLTPELLARVKAQKAALLPLLPDRPVEPPTVVSLLANATIHTVPLTDYGTPEDADAIAWAEEHLPDVAMTLGMLGHRCYERAADETEAGFRHAVEQLVRILELLRDAYAARHAPGLADPIVTPGPWRVVVGAMKLRPGPIVLDSARRVAAVDVPAFVERTLVDLESAVAQWNRGRPDTLVGRLVDEYLDHLRQCGVEVSVEVAQ